MERSRSHYHMHHPLALQGIDIDWTSMQSVAKKNKYLWQRTQLMKIIWEMYAFQHLKLQRGQCAPSEVKCIFCKK